MKNNRTFLEKLLDGAEVEWKPLGKVTDIKTGQSVSKNIIAQNPGIYPVINSGREPLGFINEWNTENDPIGITTRGAGVGSITWQEGKYFRGNLNYSVTIKSEYELNVRFLYHILLHFQKEIHNLCSFTGIPALNASELKKLEIPIPPLSVQTEIVRILDALTALTSELTSELTLRRKQYEYYRETLLLPDNLEQLNTEGAKKKLSDVVNIYLGLTYTPTYVENGVKFISAQNTSNDFLDLSNTKFISREEFEKSTSNAKPKRGDILFTRVGSNLGHPVIVDTDEDLCIFVSLGFLRVKDKNILNSYIKHWMNTNLFWKQVEKNVHGSAKVNLNTGWLKDFEIYIPTLKEQQRIVSILDKFETLTNSINKGLPLAIEQSQKRYEYYRELLLNFPGRE